MSTPSVENFLSGGGAKSASFPEVGTVVGGTIVDEPTMMQQKDIKDGSLKTWPDGNPVMQLVVKVQTDLRDSDEPDDDGVRAIYIGSKGMKDAVRDALKKAGAKAPQVGGVLKVAFTATEPASTKGFNDRKIYQAVYEPPTASASASFFGTDKTDTTKGDAAPPW